MTTSKRKLTDELRWAREQLRILCESSKTIIPDWPCNHLHVHKRTDRKTKLTSFLVIDIEREELMFHKFKPFTYLPFTYFLKPISVLTDPLPAHVCAMIDAFVERDWTYSVEYIRNEDCGYRLGNRRILTLTEPDLGGK